MRAASDATPISVDELRALAARRFGDMVKVVVDLRRGLMLLDADLHADQEAELLAFGNRSRGVDDPETRDRIASLVGRLVRR